MASKSACSRPCERVPASAQGAPRHRVASRCHHCLAHAMSMALSVGAPTQPAPQRGLVHARLDEKNQRAPPRQVINPVESSVPQTMTSPHPSIHGVTCSPRNSMP